METIAAEFDSVLPLWEWSIRQERLIAAPPAAVWRAVEAVHTQEMPLATALSKLRTFGHGEPETDEPAVTLFERTGWVRLSEVAERELILGMVGQFWKADVGIRPVADRAEFITFEEPGYGKIAFRFQLEPERNGTRLITETHVHATDRAAAHHFRWYWTAISLGARLVVGSMMRAIARRAERPM